MAPTQWPIEDADLDQIVLDPRNVRVRAGHGDNLPAHEPRLAEGAIVTYMVEAEDVLSLMNDILQNGYLDNEIPVVLRTDAGVVVLEGNRRLTALKLIDDPGLLGSEAPRARRIISRHPDHDTPTRIRVMMAPSWEAAQPLLARLHTGSSKKAWLPEQQSIFFHAQLDGSTTVDDLRVAFPAQASGIARFVLMGEMREVIRSMRYDDPELRTYVLNSELKMTAFEYVYRPKRLQQALALGVDKDGLLATKTLSEGQRRAVEYILSRLKAKTLNTRAPELIAKNPEHERFVALIEQIVAGEGLGPPPGTAQSSPASASPRGQGSAGSGSNRPGDGAAPGTGSSGGSSDQAADGARSRGPNRGDTKHRLDFTGFVYAGSSSGMRRRFEELRALDVVQFPNAAHDLLRTVLECSIKDYFRAKGEALSGGKTLGYAVDVLAREFRKDSKMTGHINAIKVRGSTTAERHAGTAMALNLTNHEPDQLVVGREVHEGWDRLKPILITIVGTPLEQ